MFVAVAIIVASQSIVPHNPFLSPMFGNNMVLQRNQINTFWGWTRPNEAVTVRIGDDKASAKSNANGEWQVRIKPPKGQGPYDVIIDGPEHAELHDVLVGDVWLCSGQSNMEFGITMAANGVQAVDDANQPNIRLYIVPHNYGYTPVAHCLI